MTSCGPFQPQPFCDNHCDRCNHFHLSQAATKHIHYPRKPVAISPFDFSFRQIKDLSTEWDLAKMILMFWHILVCSTIYDFNLRWTEVFPQTPKNNQIMAPAQLHWEMTVCNPCSLGWDWQPGTMGLPWEIAALQFLSSERPFPQQQTHKQPFFIRTFELYKLVNHNCMYLKDNIITKLLYSFTFAPAILESDIFTSYIVSLFSHS